MEKNILFRAFLFGSTVEISEVQITKETTSSVWFTNENGKEVCERKVSTAVSFHDTHQEAKSHLFRVQEKTVERAKERLQYENKILSKIQGL